MEINYKIEEKYPENGLVEGICSLHEKPYPKNIFESQLKHQKQVIGCYAFMGKRLVGYKIGFESRSRYFESWMGTVLPEFRRRGIATQLMEMQHNWCVNKNYKYITTNASYENNPMIILNLKSGFKICGTILDRGQHLKVFFQKAINIKSN